jgi:adenosylcobinamide-GDP ribazoletransferase
MKGALDAFVRALAYFTIAPVGAREAPDAGALAALPLVGALTGAIAGAAARGVAALAPHPLAVATAFGLSIVLTGALHLDGFLDSCDALFASVCPERRLEILKDPRHGTFAVAGFAVLAAFWLAALWALPIARLPATLACSGALARWATVLNAYFVPYARAGAPTRAFENTPPLPSIILEGSGILAAASWLWSVPPACALVAAAAAAALLGGDWARRRLGGGVTGDAYGFLITALEVLILVAASCARLGLPVV